MGYYYDWPDDGELVYQFYYIRPMRERVIGDCDQCERTGLLEFWLYRESDDGLIRVGRLCHICAEEYEEV